LGEMIDWMQSNWFELGSLLVQCAILATLAWYGRETLRILRDSQNQGESLERLKLSVASDERPTIQHPATSTEVEGAHHSDGEIAAVWRNLINWLQAPMESRDAIFWPGFIRWFKAPM
jgi:hypothetical protein